MVCSKLPFCWDLNLNCVLVSKPSCNTQPEQLRISTVFLFFYFCVIQSNTCELFMAASCGGNKILYWYKFEIYESLGIYLLMNVNGLLYLMFCFHFLDKESLAKLWVPILMLYTLLVFLSKSRALQMNCALLLSTVHSCNRRKFRKLDWKTIVKVRSPQR